MTSSNVSFLNSGNLLHTIFPKSQCWCVDDESIFVLRIRQDNYYRIELPHQTAEDKEKVEQLKTVLDVVLLYEKTQCPFRRGFDVELPERPSTPTRRQSKKTPEKAKKWLFDKTWVPEDGPRPSTPLSGSSDSGTNDDRSSISTRSDRSSDSPRTLGDTTPSRPALVPSVPERAKRFQGTHSITTTPISASRRMSSFAQPSFAYPVIPEEVHEGLNSIRPFLGRTGSGESQSMISSADSFYSLDNSPSLTPPFMDAEAELINPWSEEHSPEEPPHRGRGRHRRRTSDLTMRASSTNHVDAAVPVTPAPVSAPHRVTTPTTGVHPSSAPSTPPLVSDSDDDSIRTPSLDLQTPPNTIRLRRLTGTSQRRAFSPMPRPQNLFFPPRHDPRKQFTAALIRRTCELVLGPPAHLVQLMLRIAARISEGVFGFNTYRVRHTGEKIPCSWESSDEDEWPEEDDFGIPLRTLDESTGQRRGYSGDID